MLLPAAFVSQRLSASPATKVSADGSRVEEGENFYLYDLENQSLPMAEARAKASFEFEQRNEAEFKELDKGKLKQKLAEFGREWERDHAIPSYFPAAELSFALKSSEGRVLEIMSFSDLSRDGYQAREYDEIEIFSPRVSFALHSLNIQSSMLKIAGKRLFFHDSNEPNFLKYINLDKFESDIGAARLPVFRVPLSASWNGELDFSFNAFHHYQFGNLIFSPAQLEYYENIEEVSYNLAINLLDKNTYKDAYQTVQELDLYFSKGLELAGEGIDDWSSLVTGKEGAQFREKLSKDLLATAAHSRGEGDQSRKPVDTEQAVAEIDRAVEMSEDPKAKNAENQGVVRPDSSSHFVKYQRLNNERIALPEIPSDEIERLASVQIENRSAHYSLNKLRRLLTLPRAFSSNRLLGTLEAMEQDGLLEAPAQNKLSKMKKSGGRFWNSTLEKVAGIRASLGSHSKKILTALLLSSTALLFLHPAAPEALDDTLGFITHAPEMVKFLSQEGEWGRMAVRILLGGVGSIALIASVTHFSVVFHHIYRDWKSRTDAATVNFKQFIVDRQARLQSEFEESLDGVSEVAKSKKATVDQKKQTAPQFSAEDDKKVADILAGLKKEGRVAGLVASAKEKFSELAEEEPFVLAREEISLAKEQLFALFRKEKLPEDGEAPVKVGGFVKALMHSMFSMIAFTDSQRSIIPFYNKIFFIRSFAYKPFMSALWLRHPKAASRILMDFERLTLPTQANGGLRGRVDHMKLWFKPEHRKLQSAWEEKIIEVESVIEKMALREASKALVAKMDRPEELQNFYAGNGIESISDPEIMKLSKQKQKYFGAYYSVISEEILVKHLKRVAAPNGEDRSEMSLEELKTATFNDIENLDIAESEALGLLSEVKAEHNIDELVQARMQEAGWGENSRWKAVSKLDPESSRQTKRIQSVKKKLLDPIAVGRAVRQALSGIFVDKPLEFFMMVLCLMSVDSGINQLFTSEFLSADSIFYLGRFPFLMGFVFGTLLSVLAEAWMKLQIDEGNEENFGEVPEGEDSKLSRLGWWFKQTFKNKDNQILKNHVHISKLVWANIPAYLTMIIPIQLLFLGRVELDTLIAGYMLYFLSPLSSAGIHLDQGFEYSSYYDLKHFPKELRRHPEVLKYLNAQQTKSRLVFNVFAKTYENFVGFFSNTLMTLKVAGMGSKSFIRSLFGGFLPAEWILNASQSVENAAAGIPVAKQAAEAMNGTCEFFLERKYTDGERLIPATGE